MEKNLKKKVYMYIYWAQLVKNLYANAGDLDSQVRKISWKWDRLPTPVFLGFPGGSESKESACKAGDLGWEDPLEEGMATHSSILAWRIPMNRGAWWATVHGVAESWIQLSIVQHNTKSEYLNIFCDTISDHFAAHLKLTQHCKSIIPPQKKFPRDVSTATQK